MTRRPTHTLQTTMLLMMALQTIGSIDVKHKLPAPKQYVAITVLWSLLFSAADMGYGKLAARFSLLAMLTATVLGPFGKRLASFLETVSRQFAVSPDASTPTPPGATPRRGGGALSPGPASPFEPLQPPTF